MSQFTEDEQHKILLVKEIIKNSLSSFILTMAKLDTVSGNYSTCYFVSGGCTASLLQNETPKDYDVYFYLPEQAKRVIQLYTEDDSYKNEVEVFDEKYRDVAQHPNGLMITENAITLKNRIQLITKHYGSPEDIRKTFDFVHCTPYYNSLDDKFYISREQYDCCVNKVLKLNRASNPQASREQKFINRGYKWP